MKIHTCKPTIPYHYLSFALIFLLTSCSGMREAAVNDALDRGDFQKAVSYMQGLSLAERNKTVVAWCNRNQESASVGESSQSMVNTAYCYEKGLGSLPINRTLAAKWYEKALSLGDEEGRQGLARLGCVPGDGC